MSYRTATVNRLPMPADVREEADSWLRKNDTQYAWRAEARDSIRFWMREGRLSGDKAKRILRRLNNWCYDLLEETAEADWREIVAN